MKDRKGDKKKRSLYRCLFFLFFLFRGFKGVLGCFFFFSKKINAVAVVRGWIFFFLFNAFYSDEVVLMKRGRSIPSSPSSFSTAVLFEIEILFPSA